MISGYYHYVAMTGDIAEDDFKPKSQWSEDATGTSHCHPNVLSYLAALERFSIRRNLGWIDH